jgi:peptide/nickel transport system ATP-binding protein
MRDVRGPLRNDCGQETVEAEPVLSVRKLVVRLKSQVGLTHAVNDITFDLLEGETLAVVGESGSGKTASFLALLRLLPRASVIEASSLRFEGRDLLELDDNEIRTLRGSGIAMVFQDPMTSLNPVLTIGEQLTETILAHMPVGREPARSRAIHLLEEVGIPEAEARFRGYPHELSGGMRQRVMIAMALALDPRVLIADEPTTALDVTIQAQILELLRRLTRERRTSLVLITHDLGVVARMADRVNVLYAGEIVETATTADLFDQPSHPYTIGLLRSLPHLDRRIPLEPIRGNPPDLEEEPPGCPFAPRCSWRIGRCVSDRPVLLPIPSTAGATKDTAGSHRIACHNPPARAETMPGKSSSRYGGGEDRERVGTMGSTVDAAGADGKPGADLDGILSVTDLSVHFPIRKGLIFDRHVADVKAVDGVSFMVRRRETLGLVGESGCGKTTIGRAIVRLVRPTSGAIVVDGTDVTHLPDAKMKLTRRRMQMVFQDSYSSLNPRMTVDSIIREPLEIFGIGTEHERSERVANLMIRVGLDPSHGTRYPHEFSGGQRQRIGIARALAPSPGLVIADEPVSALDVSVQAQIINLLEELQCELGLALLFIAHNLTVVERLSHRTAVMYLGRIVETAPSHTLKVRPLHPYTIALRSAIPVPDPAVEAQRKRIILRGDVPSPVSPPSGCRFNTRCWLRQTLDNPEICAEVDPSLCAVDDEHAVACHFAHAVDGSPQQRQVAPRER